MNALQELGLNIKYSEWKKKDELPLFITNDFLIQKAVVNGIDCLSLTPNDDLSTLPTLKKQLKQIQDIDPLPIFLHLTALSNVRRDSLLKHNIPFIVSNKMVYLPFMATFILNKPQTSKDLDQRFTVSTQLLLMWILYRNSDRFYIGKAVEELHFSNMTISRAYRQLVAAKLLQEHKDGRKIYLTIDSTKRDLFERSKKFFRNPIVRTGFLMKKDLTNEMVLSGDSALSILGFINPPKLQVYAIEKSKAKELVLQTELISNEEQVKLEIWDYDPFLWSENNNMIDPLSLVISQLDNKDERVEMEIERILDRFL